MQLGYFLKEEQQSRTKSTPYSTGKVQGKEPGAYTLMVAMGGGGNVDMGVSRDRWQPAAQAEKWGDRKWIPRCASGAALPGARREKQTMIFMAWDMDYPSPPVLLFLCFLRGWAPCPWQLIRPWRCRKLVQPRSLPCLAPVAEQVAVHSADQQPRRHLPRGKSAQSAAGVHGGQVVLPVLEGLRLQDEKTNAISHCQGCRHCVS